MNIKANTTNGIIYDSVEEYRIIEFIAVGGESIVFKGIKESVGRTYALKLRNIDRWEDFLDYELKALSKLEQCSTSKLAGIIPIIPRRLTEELYDLIPKNKIADCHKLKFPDAEYFCIVEDYISGCDLKEYCEGNESKGIAGHTPSLNASYEQVVDFQRKILNWTMQFCEIMIHVTGDNNYLHLDIKPENIMISNETESVTVIDFGKSIECNEKNKTVSLAKEFGNDIGVYGTNGFAAPECCDSQEMRSSLGVGSTGNLDVRSDIFSFGAVLWDCINPSPNIYIKPTESGYFRRDLFNTPLGYIPELEEIVVKCTEKKPENRYRDYNELKSAAIYAEKKLLEREKPNKNLIILSILTGIIAICLILSMAVNNRKNNLTYEIARADFDKMAAEYTEHNISEYEKTALALIEANPDERQSYLDVLEVSYKNDDYVSKKELEDVLFKCLDNTDDKSITMEYANTIMQHVNKNELITISKSLAEKPLINGIDCEGINIANAAFKFNDDPKAAYDIVKRYSTKEYKEYEDTISILKKEYLDDKELKKKIEKEGIPLEDIERLLQ